jgi:hypothetical protein
LILRRGRDILLHRKIGEKTLQLLLAGESFGQLAECDHVMTQPMQISLFRGHGFMLATDDRTSALKGFGGIHGKLLSVSFNTFNDYPSLNHS